MEDPDESSRLILLLTIRFSSSHPDLPLDVLPTAPIASLKRTLRTSLPTLARRRLRLIHQGKILPDAASLQAALDPKGKGKFSTGTGVRIFLNCSIGDVLTGSELKEEARLAVSTTSTSTSTAAAAGGVGRDGGSGQNGSSPTDAAASSLLRTQGTSGQDGTTPRGFDRLLAAGFTPAEVNQLRLQFTSIQATRHTPDAMPSPDTLRGMEDSWIDDNGAAGVSAAGGGEDGDGAMIGDMLDELLHGIVSGFFWPLGTVCWLARQEGLWSKRRQMFVIFGVVISISIGLFKTIAGEAE